MSGNLGEFRRGERDGQFGEFSLRIGEQDLSHLINVLAVGEWNLCSGDAVDNPTLCQSSQAVVQSILEQAYEMGGPDAVWCNPRDGRYYHPSFAEGEGEAWDANQEHEAECAEIRVTELAALELAERNRERGGDPTRDADYYMQQLQDCREAGGLECLMAALVHGTIR